MVKFFLENIVFVLDGSADLLLFEPLLVAAEEDVDVDLAHLGSDGVLDLSVHLVGPVHEKQNVGRENDQEKKRFGAWIETNYTC